MNTAIVCYIYPPEIAPAGQMTRELSEHLAEEGHGVTVVTAFPNHPKGEIFEGYKKRIRLWEQDEPFRVLRVWHTTSRRRNGLTRSLFYVSFAVSSLIQGLCCGSIDMVLSLSTPIVGGLAGLLLARLKRAGFVYGVWDIYPELAAELGMLGRGALYSILRRIDTWICRRADKVVVLSEGFGRTMLERGVPDDKVEVLPIWLDSDEVSPQPRLNAWRQEQGIADDAFVVLYAGTIGLVSGARVVLDAAQQLAGSAADVLFLFVGAGMVRDEIEEGARELDLANVRMLPFQPRERLAEVQSTADVSLVTLLPGQGDGSVPSKVLGYMAAARPIVASVDSDSDTASWVGAAECGVVVPPQDPGALAQAILDLRADTARREALGRNGREYLVAHFSHTAALAQYERLLGKVAADRAASA